MNVDDNERCGHPRPHSDRYASIRAMTVQLHLYK